MAVKKEEPGSLRRVISIATAMGVLPAIAGLLLRDRTLFIGGLTLVALSVVATGVIWIATGRAATKYLPVQHGVKARLMGVAAIGVASLLLIGALAALPAAR